jgi:hypothetical protein
VIPATVTEIGGRAFDGCSKLKELVLPPGLTSIADGTFSECSGLKEVSIPPGVTEVGDCAFCDSSGLTMVVIPASVKKVGPWAFQNCSSLRQVTIPADLAEFRGNNAFAGVTIPKLTLVGSSISAALRNALKGHLARDAVVAGPRELVGLELCGHTIVAA